MVGRKITAGIDCYPCLHHRDGRCLCRIRHLAGPANRCDLKAERDRLERVAAPPPDAELVDWYVSLQIYADATMPTSDLKREIVSLNDSVAKIAASLGDADLAGATGYRLGRARTELAVIDTCNAGIMTLGSRVEQVMHDIASMNPEERERRAEMFLSFTELRRDFANLWTDFLRHPGKTSLQELAWGDALGLLGQRRHELFDAAKSLTEPPATSDPA
jgi:hypothetical protein